MFGIEELHKLFENISQTMRMMAETLAKNTESIRGLNDQDQKIEKNVNTLINFTAKNAANITAVPWEVSNLNLAYEKALGLIEKQDSKISRLEEVISKVVSADFKSNEETKQRLNELTNVVTTLVTYIQHQDKNHSEFFEALKIEYPKTRTVLEYLVLATTSESKSSTLKK